MYKKMGEFTRLTLIRSVHQSNLIQENHIRHMYFLYLFKWAFFVYIQKVKQYTMYVCTIALFILVPLVFELSSIFCTSALTLVRVQCSVKLAVWFALIKNKQNGMTSRNYVKEICVGGAVSLSIEQKTTDRWGVYMICDGRTLLKMMLSNCDSNQLFYFVFCIIKHRSNFYLCINLLLQFLFNIIITLDSELTLFIYLLLYLLFTILLINTMKNS